MEKRGPNKATRAKITEARLLTPGWGGELTPDELVYIKSRLKESPELRRRWGFTTTRISDAMIRKVALDGVDQGQNSTEMHHTPAEMYLREKRKRKT